MDRVVSRYPLDTMNKIRREHAGGGCPVEASFDAIGGRWKGVILYHLLQGTLRFGELSRRIGCVTQRVLTHQLRELEADGLVARTIYAEMPPRVEYRLTERGETLRPAIEVLLAWGEVHGRTIVSERAARADAILSSRT